MERIYYIILCYAPILYYIINNYIIIILQLYISRRQNLDMHADGGLQRLFDEAWTKYEALRSDVGAASLYFWTSAKTICGYQ